MTNRIELAVTLGLSHLARGHRAEEAAVADFLSDVREIAGVSVRQRDVMGESGKGALQDVILALSGPGAAAGIVQVVRLWLNRDRNRSIVVRMQKPDEQPLEIRASGNNVSLESLQNAILASLEANKAESEERAPGSTD